MFADADLELAGLHHRAQHPGAGHACVAGWRLIVAREVADALAAAIARHMADIRLAATWDENAQ